MLSVLNKNNYGYLSPSDFNLFAKQAQLEIFEDLFHRYNRQINKENSRNSGTGLADIKKGIEQEINVFSTTSGLYTQGSGVYYKPSDDTTGSDYYLLNKVLVYDGVLKEGTTTGTAVGNNVIVDSSATFTSDGISVGDKVAVESGGVQYLSVVSVDSDTEITVSSTILDSSPLDYSIYAASATLNEAEMVSHGKITMLNNSSLTAPTVMFPAYVTEGDSLQVYPESVDSVGRVTSQYIRYPRDPKWTFVSLSNGEHSTFPNLLLKLASTACHRSATACS